MTDDLQRRLDALAQRSPEGTKDLGAILQGGGRIKRRRMLMGGIASVLVVALAGAGAWALLDRDAATPRPQPQHHDDGVFIPADENDVTYVLTDFRIFYPYSPIDHKPLSEGQRHRLCDARPADCRTRSDEAGVAIAHEWSTNRYPGEVQCQTTLLDKRGNVVGQELWGLDSMQKRIPIGGRPLRPTDFVLVMDVTGKPVRAEGACEKSAYKPGPGLRWTFLGSEVYEPEHQMPGEEVPPRLRLLFDVEVVGGSEHVDSRICESRFEFESGKVVTGEFTTNTGPGREVFETGYPASDPIVDAEITCRTYRGEGQQDSD